MKTDGERALDMIRAVFRGDFDAARDIAKPRWGSGIWGAGDFLALAERIPHPLGPVTLMVGEIGGGADGVMGAIKRMRPFAMEVRGWLGGPYQTDADRGPVPMPGWLLSGARAGKPLPETVSRLVGRDDVAHPDARDAIAGWPPLWGAYAAVEVMRALAAKALPEPPLLLLPGMGDGLHPAVAARLGQMVLRDAPGPVQIIATTTSPEVVDAAELDAVLVFARGDDGVPRCKRLSQHPDAERHGRILRPGEFWTTVGEEWVLEG